MHYDESKTKILFRVTAHGEKNLLFSTDAENRVVIVAVNEPAPPVVEEEPKLQPMADTTTQQPVDDSAVAPPIVQSTEDTISKMPTAQSAKILETMMGTDANVAMDIFRDLDSDTRSQILAVIAQENENLATQITADLKE